MSGPGHNAAVQLKSIIDRILRLKEEQKALADDIRDVYAEAKFNGYDKTALGKVVTQLWQRAKDPDRFDELDSIATIYLHAYEGRAHAREGIIPHDPETGEITDDFVLAPPSSVADGEGSSNAADEVPGAGGRSSPNMRGQSAETTVDVGRNNSAGTEPVASPSAIPHGWTAEQFAERERLADLYEEKYMTRSASE